MKSSWQYSKAGSGQKPANQCALLSTLLAATCLLITTSANASGSGSAPEKLSEIEKSVVGTVNSKAPVEQRLKQLEIKVFARVQSGSLNSRLEALEKFAGVLSSDYMPPLPPQFDNGKDPVKKVPERAVAEKSINAKSANDSQKLASKSSAINNSTIKTATSKSTIGKNATYQKIAQKSLSGKHAVGKLTLEKSGESGLIASKIAKPETKAELEEAVKLHHEGKEIEAEQSLKNILSHNPKNSDAYFSLGAIAESKGDLQAALEYYTSAVQANPNDSEAQDAVAELSRKVTAAANAPFVNPLDQYSAPAPNVLQGRALALDANGGAGNTNLLGQTGRCAPPPIASQNITQPTPHSTFARVLARAALGAALSGTGLHCPVCSMMKGF